MNKYTVVILVLLGTTIFFGIEYPKFKKHRGKKITPEVYSMMSQKASTDGKSEIEFIYKAGKANWIIDESVFEERSGANLSEKEFCFDKKAEFESMYSEKTEGVETWEGRDRRVGDVFFSPTLQTCIVEQIRYERIGQELLLYDGLENKLLKGGFVVVDGVRPDGYQQRLESYQLYKDSLR